MTERCRCGKHFWVGDLETGNWVKEGMLVRVAVEVGTVCDGSLRGGVECGDALLDRGKTEPGELIMDLDYEYKP